MKELKSISEVKILYYAWYGVIEEQKRYRRILATNPNSPTAKARLAHYKEQEKELHERIRELEGK